MRTTREAVTRQAKARLSELLRVQLGRESVITERGKPVARLMEAAGLIERRPVSQCSLPRRYR